MIKPGLPERVEIELEPVIHGRVQILCRVTTEDKNDVMRVVNMTGLNQQDVMRMFIMRGVRKLLAMVKAQEDADQRITEVMQPTEIKAPEPVSEPASEPPAEAVQELDKADEPKS